MSNSNNILLAFYGDDFTGSTDALEFIARAGAKCVLFIDPPTTAQLQSFPGVNVIGVAGKTRSMAPADMETTLLHAFAALQSVQPKQLHYKVCSTFDSAPHIGSIGKAMECGKKICNNQRIVVLGGMPALGRYCAFGNLYARMGTAEAGVIFRLDRHPSMSRHPVTPADESDLRIHLSKQTTLPIGLINCLQMAAPVEQWHSFINDDEEAILTDAITTNDLLQFGNWLDAMHQQQQETIFSVGSSGVEMALGMCWQQQGILPLHNDFSTVTAAEPLLVLSGSCSPVTAAQISYALQNGFTEVIIDPSGNNDAPLQQIITLLQQSKHVLVHTGERKSHLVDAAVLGSILGNIAAEAATQTNVKRIVIAGGDTSSYAARAMQIDAVEILSPLVPGAPLCTAHSHNTAIHGLQVNFKGGQVGPVDYFEIMQKGNQ